MVVLIRGKTVCAICGKVIYDGQAVQMFRPFVSNELDPLHFTSDAALHKECFLQHPLSAAVSSRYQEMLKRTALPFRCRICAKVIDDPEDYCAFGHLTTNEGDQLFKYNYAMFHRHCLHLWADKDAVKRQLEELRLSGEWRGVAIDWIIKDLS